ncbi:hypothetical protein [Curtobacterium herbarum]|uniref:Uncharacterized protein n=1 Tax=Curtobacterium herbarum TaxID=150122 RepID=A0ABN1ZD10_9MICO|nr:hypothetical protein [Curtobacterium herbarum]MBM7475649.1 hypothetical protein [Curtobacterium herbarum]MCS6543562.1 hypothetical protein [Curtobacterium herbarum]
MAVLLLFPIGVVGTIVLLALAVRGSAQKSPTQERQDAEWRARRADRKRARSRS